MNRDWVNCEVKHHTDRCVIHYRHYNTQTQTCQHTVC